MKKNKLDNYLRDVQKSFLGSPLSPAGERLRVRGASSRLIMVLLILMGMLLLGCGDLPFAKKSLPPQTQLEPAYEAPPPLPAPLDPGPVAKPAPQMVYAPGGSNVSDTRLADLASQFEALRARLQVVEGKLAEQENQMHQLTQSGNPQQAQMRDKLTGLERDLAAAQERLARLEGQRPSQPTESNLRPLPLYEKFLLPRLLPKPAETPYKRG